MNTNFTTAAGKLDALVEAGSLPVELDDELECVARSDFGGALEAGFRRIGRLNREERPQWERGG